MDVLGFFFSHSCTFNSGQSNHFVSFISAVYTEGVSCVSLPLSETPDVARQPTASFAIIRLR